MLADWKSGWSLAQSDNNADRPLLVSAADVNSCVDKSFLAASGVADRVFPCDG